jgi:hypothetical protein
MEMKNSIGVAMRLFLTASLMVVAQQVFAETPVGVAAIAVEAKKAERGAFKTNDSVYVSDQFTTGPKGTITILFNDESLFTLGANGHAKIEVYDEGAKGVPGKSIIRVYKGQFRYFPGAILAKGGTQLVSGATPAAASDALTSSAVLPNAPASEGLPAPNVVPSVPSPSTLAPVIANPMGMGMGH